MQRRRGARRDLGRRTGVGMELLSHAEAQRDAEGFGQEHRRNRRRRWNFFSTSRQTDRKSGVSGKCLDLGGRLISIKKRLVGDRAYVRTEVSV